MNDIKKIVEVNGKTYPLVYNLNVMEKIQEKYGSVRSWGSVISPGEGEEPKIKDLKFGIMEMINEGIDIENETSGENRKLITEKEAGRLLTEIGLANAASKIMEVTVESVANEGQEKNA